jgi:2-haloalkanoic acid dehalogenase type II
MEYQREAPGEICPSPAPARARFPHSGAVGVPGLAAASAARHRRDRAPSSGYDAHHASLSEEEPMTARLTDHEVLTFDCYGTLIDWESGIWDALQPLLMANGCSEVTRNVGLELFSRHEHEQQMSTPDLLYPQVLTTVHGAIAGHLRLHTSAALDAAFGASVAHWPAFPDTADALRYLKTRFKLVILSNVNRDGFAASNRKLGVEFDAIYTAQDIGSYKPSPRNFEYLLTHLRSDLGLEPGAVLHTAQSLHHDHVQARAFGLANAWIDRQHLSESGAWGATAPVEDRPETDFLFLSMAEMADAVRAEAG